MSDTPTQQGNRRRRNRRPNGGGQDGSYSGPRSSTPRGGVPQQTGFQKFLSLISFGILGRPTTLPKAQRSAASPTSSDRGPRPPRDRDRDRDSSRPPREPRPRRDEAPVDPASIATDRLYIGNLSYDASESDLFELFNGVGSVRNAEVVVNNRTQRSKGFAFVTMSSVEEARRAVSELSGKEFMGRPLQLSGAKPIGEDRSSQDDES